MASFQTNCVREVADILSPEMLEQVGNWEDMTPEQLLEHLQTQAQQEESVTFLLKPLGEQETETNGMLRIAKTAVNKTPRIDTK